MSSKDNDKERVMCSHGDNIELFQSLLSNYQIGLEASVKGSDFILIVFIYRITNTIK